jgi:ABC-type glycerol-3-phosphate transport system substrate-binding protein
MTGVTPTPTISAGAVSSTSSTVASHSGGDSRGRQEADLSGPAETGPLHRAYREHPEVAGKVRLAHCWDGARTALVEAWIADFQSRYPSISVEDDVRDAASIRNRLVTIVAGDSVPNLVMLRSDTIPFFADQGLLQALDDRMSRDAVLSDWFMASELASHRWQGRTYGLPQVTAGAQHLLFVNTDRLYKLGGDPSRPFETWQDLEALIEPAQKSGLLVLDPSRVPAGATLHQLLTYANDGQYWDDDLEQIGWAGDAGVEAAGWLRHFAGAQVAPGQRAGAPAEGASRPAPSADDAVKGALTPDEWELGRHLCCINGAGWFFQLHQQAQQVQYAAYPFPRNAANPDSTGATPMTGGWTLAIPRSAPDQDAAWELLKLATVSVSACAFTARQRRPSPLAGCDDETGLDASQPFWPSIMTSLSRGVAVPISPIQPRLERIYQEMQAAIVGASQSPRDVLEGAAREAQHLLDEWNASRARL